MPIEKIQIQKKLETTNPPSLEQPIPTIKEPKQEAVVIPLRARKKAISELRTGCASGAIEMAEKYE